MGEAQLQGLREVLLEILTVDLVGLVIAAQGLAPVPSQLLLIGGQTV
jgi:hypothetical protein